MSADSTLTSSPEGVVILGAGVIGLSTAYYLALALNESKFSSSSSSSSPAWPPVVVVDPSHRICPAASGEATGGLGDFGFDSYIAPLGLLSYRLHKDLASRYDGKEKWGFTDLEVYRVSPKDFTGSPSPPDSWGPTPPKEKQIIDLPDWLKPSKDWVVQLLADAPHAAHLVPRQFCHFLHKRCEELGVQFHLNSAVKSYKRDDSKQSFTSVTIESRSPERSSRTIPCNAMVIAAGPWSGRVFSQLFPTSQRKLYMNSTGSAGTHAFLRNPNWKAANNVNMVTQVFLNDLLPGSEGLDITSFPDGSLYIGGWGATPEQVPEYADDVHAQPDQLQEMLKAAKAVLNFPVDEAEDAINPGRCYRPVARPNRPIVGKAEWPWSDDNALEIASRQDLKRLGHLQSNILGGLYINTGHNSDGVTLAPGSGKIMSEYLLGYPPSVHLPPPSFLNLKGFMKPTRPMKMGL